jgi:1,4-alpha-glucan branching enzyme
MVGELSIVVSIHTPYLRHHGRDPIGEDALHSTIAETIVPLLNALHDLRAAAIPTRLGLACSPVLMEQLADPVVQKHFLLWMEGWLTGVEANLTRWSAEGQHHLRYLAQFYLEWGQTIVSSFRSRYHRHLMGVLRELCEAGIVEPLLLPATDADLARLGTASAVQGQIEAAMLNTLRHLGQLPKGLWLNHGYRQGLEQILRRAGLSYLVLPSSGIEGGQNGWLLSRRVAALARDDRLEYQSFSEELGYPGDPLYRATEAGIGALEPAYRRNGRADPDSLAEWYDPYYAFQRAQEHAQHFVLACRERARLIEDGERPPLLLCGMQVGYGQRRWFEQISWLRNLIELVDDDPELELITPGSYLYQHPPRQTARGQIRPQGPDTTNQRLGWASERMRLLVTRLPDADALQERLLNQAGRELLLAQDGAWAARGASADGQAERSAIAQHLDRFDWLCERVMLPLLEVAEIAELEDLEERDGVFPLLNYRVFSEDQG